MVLHDNQLLQARVGCAAPVGSAVSMFLHHNACLCNNVADKVINASGSPVGQSCGSLLHWSTDPINAGVLAGLCGYEGV